MRFGLLLLVLCLIGKSWSQKIYAGQATPYGGYATEPAVKNFKLLKEEFSKRNKRTLKSQKINERVQYPINTGVWKCNAVQVQSIYGYLGDSDIAMEMRKNFWKGMHAHQLHRRNKCYSMYISNME